MKLVMFNNHLIEFLVKWIQMGQLNPLDHNLYKMLSSVPVIEHSIYIYMNITFPDQHFIVISLYTEVWSYNPAFYRCFPFVTIVNKIFVL